MKIVRLKDAKDWPEFGTVTEEMLKEAYALARAAFTAEDLQNFTEIEEGVAMDIFLAELESAQADNDRKQAP